MRSAIRFIVLVLCLGLLGAAHAATKRVLGRLGQATTTVGIHSAPSARSRTYYRVRPFEYLVVRHSNQAAWTQVLMSNGQYGYIPANAVAELPYEVTTGASRASYGAVASRSSGSSIANYALNFVGTPYKWGGNDVQNGIDCSGFVQKMYGAIGYNLPRTAAEQAMVGQPITQLEDLVPGDRLYFWEAKRGKIGHTGIYLGGGYFVHSSNGHRGVATDYLSARWRKILVAARR